MMEELYVEWKTETHFLSFFIISPFSSVERISLIACVCYMFFFFINISRILKKKSQKGNRHCTAGEGEDHRFKEED